jgi:hypothetical protein
MVVVAVAACGTKSGSGSSGTSGGGGSNGNPSATQAPRQHFADDFEPACQGVAVSSAKAYDKAAPSHKVVYFSTYKDGKLVDSSSGLPQDWYVLFDKNTDAYAAVDLVICATRTSQTFVKDCDGYTVDNKPDALVVKWFTANYKAAVYEAKTGKQLATKDLAATDSECPSSEFGVPAGTKTMNDYATPNADDVVALAKPFAQP